MIAPIDRMNLSERFEEHWREQFSQFALRSSRLLLAVSGGADSVVLTDLIHKAGFDYAVAHCNFQLRGEESERDEQFVRALGKKNGKEVLVKRFDTSGFAKEKNLSVQEAARELRYAWFDEIIRGWDPKTNNCIVTAHHADDNIETVLMHFFRGTGIHGLTGIQPFLSTRKLLRPLLPFRKQELLDHAQEKGLVFVEDSSNASDKYTRNFFRNDLLPRIRDVFPQADDNLLRNIGRFAEAEELYRQAVNMQKQKLLEQKGNEWHVPVLKWKKAQPLHTITWEIIREFGFHAHEADEMIKLLDSANGSYRLSSTHRIIHNRNWMIITPHTSTVAGHIIVEETDNDIRFDSGHLKIQHTKFKIHNNPQEAFLNPDEIQFPLLLRKYKTGDYFYPLGMQKKKKLSRFLMDLKLSATEKENVWVLESNKRIVWVIGYRIDNRFRVTDPEKNALRVTWTAG